MATAAVTPVHWSTAEGHKRTGIRGGERLKPGPRVPSPPRPISTMPSVLLSLGRWLRRRLPYIAGAFIVSVGAAVAVYFAFVRAPGDVQNDDVEFVEEAPTKKKRASETFIWPFYGYTPDRARYLDTKIGPPFRGLWRFNAGDLLEYPPVLAKGTLFTLNRKGETFALDSRTGKLKWKRRIGNENAASPAWAANRLFVPSFTDGLTALNARNGKVQWNTDIPDGAESGPFIMDGIVYTGSGSGTVYALRARDGKKVWTYQADGPVKGALAYSNGNVYFGDYSGEVTALRAKDGAPVWNSSTSGASFSRAGDFYSTPAVAFGRVYLGNTDGKVYSFSAKTGELAWTKTTGSVVYGAPAVARVPGTKPTVYIGSNDGKLYALDARTGGERWQFDTGGQILGSTSVVGRLAYVSNFDGKTFGVDVASGKRAFMLDGGRYASAISDGRRLYVSGFSSVRALVPEEAAGGKGNKGAKRKARSRRGGSE